MSQRRVVITGMGLVNPLGGDRESFWKSALAGECAVDVITRFDPAGLPVTLAAEITGFRAKDHVPRRLMVKSDTFAHYAMAAAGEAIDHSALDLSTMDPFRVGISFGNNSGGWDLCERGFREYYGQDPTMINPWQATAWFPTAAQGFVSIRYGIRGFSKSFAADRASGACGLVHGLRTIRWDHNDVVLAGGAEAPISRLGVAAHVTTGELSEGVLPEHGYLPFAERRNGLVLGEGATVMVLEELEHARARGAQIHGELLAVEQRTAPPSDHTGLSDAITAALRSADRAPSDVDLVFAEGCGTVDGDAQEAAALREVFGERGVPVTVPKAGYGHQYGASAATELVTGLLGVRDSVMPPTPLSGGSADECGIDLVTEPRSTPVRTVLINARSREGTNVAALVAAY